MKITLVNSRADNPQNSTVWFSVMGQDEAGNWCHMIIDTTTGQGHMAKCELTDNTMIGPDKQAYSDYFYKLSDVPTIEFEETIISGRIRIALESKLYIEILTVKDANGNDVIGYQDASPVDPTLPNYGIVHDKFEFTYHNGGAFDCNTTCVDFFSLPITVDLTGANGTQTRGFNPGTTQQDIINAFVQKGSPWSDLILNQAGQFLRILSPMLAPPFQPGAPSGDYMLQYAADVWAYYGTCPITLESTNVDVGTPAQKVTFTNAGQVQAGLFTITSTPDNPTLAQVQTHTIALPTRTIDIFGCSGVFQKTTTGNNTIDTVDGDVKNQISAALNRSILATESSTPCTDPNWCAHDDYYQQAPTNVYSQILHALNLDGVCYGFPYDDRCDQSTLISDPEPTACTVTLTA